MKSKVTGLKFSINNKDGRGASTVLSHYTTDSKKDPTLTEFNAFMIKYRGADKLHTDEVIEIDFHVE